MNGESIVININIALIDSLPDYILVFFRYYSSSQRSFRFQYRVFKT